MGETVYCCGDWLRVGFDLPCELVAGPHEVDDTGVWPAWMYGWNSWISAPAEKARLTPVMMMTRTVSSSSNSLSFLLSAVINVLLRALSLLGLFSLLIATSPRRSTSKGEVSLAAIIFEEI